MADANVSQLEINGTTYDICDATARDSLSQDYLPLTAGENKVLQGQLWTDHVIKMRHTDASRDGTLPQTDAWRGVDYLGSDGLQLGAMSNVYRSSNGRSEIGLYAYNANNGTLVTNNFNVRMDRDGTGSYYVAYPTAFREAIGSGATNSFMRADGELTNTLENDSLKIKYDYFDLSQSNNGVSSNRWPAGLNILDKDDRAASFFGNTINSDGNVGASIYAYNIVNGTTKSNSFTVWVEKDGSQRYSFASPSAARDALAMDTWTSVTAANWITLGSDWSFDTFYCYVNTALKKVVIHAHIRTTVARSNGNLSLGTIKSGYRPKVRANISPTAGDANYSFYFDGGGAAYIGSSSLTANKVLYFAGEYSLA